MGRRLPLIAAGIFAFALAASPVAAAEPGMTAGVGDISLVGRVVVNVDVTFTCQPKPADEWPLEYRWGGGMSNFSNEIIVQLRQAAGRQQALGEATYYLDPAVGCDGMPHKVAMAVVPDGSGPAFKPGTAAMSVVADASYSVMDWGTYNQSYVSESYASGWTQVKITK